MQRTYLSVIAGLSIAALPTTPVAAQWVEKGCVELLDLKAPTIGDFWGWTSVVLDDINDDGVPDIAVAEPFWGNSIGKVWVYSGADESLLWSRQETVLSAILGFQLDTTDWNNDGVTDLIAGAPFGDFGTLWIYNGLDGSTLLELQSGEFQDGIGSAVDPNGDFNGDGVNDLLLGAFGADTAEDQINYGRVYVYSGVDASLITSIDGPFTNASFGIGVAYIGDISDPPDGRDEIVIGNRMGSSDDDIDLFFDGQARVYSYNGRDAVLEYMIEDVGMGHQLIGDRIDGGKDINQDGTPDFLIGDSYLDSVRIFSGSDGALIHEFNIPDAPASPEFGRMIDDINGDGHADLILGDWGGDGGDGLEGSGVVWVHSGADGCLLQTMTPLVANQAVGVDSRSAGDFNNDGLMDFLIAGTGGGFESPFGRVYVIAGTIAPEAIPGDLDGDGVVGPSDLITLLGAWGPCGDCGDCAADLDDDCSVGTGDLIILLGNWG